MKPKLTVEELKNKTLKERLKILLSIVSDFDIDIKSQKDYLLNFERELKSIQTIVFSDIENKVTYESEEDYNQTIIERAFNQLNN
jgi:hypothetical protein